MKPEQLFSIGDMSKMFFLSPGSLRHYESLGIVTPEYVDPETGYRYYSVRQFEPLNAVRYLRMLDMPLPEIADFLKNKDIDVIREKLIRQREATDKKLRELEIIRRKLDRRLDDLDDACASEFNVVRRCALPSLRAVIANRPLKLVSGLDLEKPIRELEASRSETAVFLGKVGVGISAEKLRKDSFDEYDCVFLLLDDEDEYGGEVTFLPACDGVTVRFRGSHTEAPAYYAMLMSFMRENGLEADGFSREVTLIDNGFTNDTAKFVTKISIPVKNA